MDLKEFIKETLISISEGVIESQNYLNSKGIGSEINPRIQSEWEKIGYVFSDSGKPIQLVEFDVDVIANEKKAGEGHVGVTVSSIGFGGKRNRETTSGSNSRIRFSIPITLPHLST